MSNTLTPAEAYDEIGKIMQRVRRPDGMNVRELDVVLAAMGSTHPLSDADLFAEIDRRIAAHDFHSLNARESMIAFGRWVRAFTFSDGERKILTKAVLGVTLTSDEREAALSFLGKS
jgi:hypothetical protein